MTLLPFRNFAEIIIHEYKFPHRTKPEFIDQMLKMQETAKYHFYEFADYNLKLEPADWEIIWEIIDVMTERMP